MNKYLKVALTAVAFVALWNIISYVNCAFIMHQAFVFSPVKDLLLPAAISVLIDGLGLLFSGNKAVQQ